MPRRTAPLSPAAVRAIENASGYGTLEYDLTTGKRGRRGAYVEGLIADLVGSASGTMTRQIDAVHLHHTWRPRRSEFRGRATVELPPGRARALDYVNAPGAFFTLFADDTTHYFNKSHVRLIRPLD